MTLTPGTGINQPYQTRTPSTLLTQASPSNGRVIPVSVVQPDSATTRAPHACVARLMIGEFQDADGDGKGYWASEKFKGAYGTPRRAKWLAVDMPDPTCTTFERQVVAATTVERFNDGKEDPAPKPHHGYFCNDQGLCAPAISGKPMTSLLGIGK